MLVYVDGIILTCNNPEVINRVVQNLRYALAIQDMGRLSYFLGIENLQQGNNVILLQKNTSWTC